MASYTEKTEKIYTRKREIGLGLRFDLKPLRSMENVF